MPWKNGGGVTTEIFASPPSEDFDWRVSIATVKSDGPFSTFIGYERHIMTLSGEGMTLDIEGRGKFALEPLKPLSFSGETRVHSSLLHGPVLDFNLMVRRDFGYGILKVMECAAGEKLEFEKNFHLVYVLQGECKVGNDKLHPNDSVYLAAGEHVVLFSPLKLIVCKVTPHGRPWPSV